jgi:hypothetical protein
LDTEEEEIAPVEMITCGTRCEPDASGPSDQSTAAAAAAAPYALFSSDRRSFRKSVQSSDEMGNDDPTLYLLFLL